MDYRRWGRIAEWGVVAAVVALHLAIFLLPEPLVEASFLFTAARDAQWLAGIALVACWAVLGPGWAWLRGGVVAALLALWLRQWLAGTVSQETTGWLAIAAAVWAAAPAVVMRVCGWRLIRVEPGGRPWGGAQFTLRDLLLGMTLIAVAIGCLEGLRATLSARKGRLHLNSLAELMYLRLSTGSVGHAWSWSEETRLVVMAAAVALAAGSTIWTVLRPGACWLRLAVLVIAIPTCGVYLTHVGGISGDGFAESAIGLTAGLAAVAAMTALSVLPLRLMDYRLQRKAAATVAKAPPAADQPRFVVRMAALAGLLTVVSGGLPIAGMLSKSHSKQIEPPLWTFAHWISEPSLSSKLSLILGSGQLEANQDDFDISVVPLEPAETPLLAPTTEQLQQIRQRLGQ